MSEKRPIFIVVTGCSSSGKTTVINDLEKILSVNYNVVRVPELVRKLSEVLEASLEDVIKFNLIYEFEALLARLQILYEKCLMNKDVDIVLMDRSVWDVLVYVRMLCSDEKFNELYDYVVNSCNEYDYVIYCEPLEFKDDGYRVNYRENGEVLLFETIVKSKADIVLEPIEHYKRMSKILNDEKFNKLLKSLDK